VAGQGSCADTSSIFILTVIPAPKASFTVSSSGLDAQFNIAGSTGNVTSYFWNFGDSDTSNLQNPSHSYKRSDTFDVCLTVFNKSDCDYTTCQNIVVYPTGINGVNANYNWKLYPNPFNNEFYIVATLNNPPVESIEIYNVLGQMVLSKNFSGAQGDLTIDASGLAIGMYFLKITTRDSEFVQPVVKE
jgi:PKD repeat protein